jgi:magnesium transporter
MRRRRHYKTGNTKLMPDTQHTSSPNGSVEVSQETTYGLSTETVRAIDDVLDEKDKQQVWNLLHDMHVADISDYIDSANSERRRQLVEFIRDDFDPEILVEVSVGTRAEVMELLGTKTSAQALTNLDTDDAVDIMEDLDEDDQLQLLQAIPNKGQRAELEEGLAYPEDSAGRLLEKGIVSVPEFWTVGQTIDHLRNAKDIPEDFYMIFVVDPKLKPVGSVLVSRMIRAVRDVKMSDLMEQDIKLISSSMDQEEVAFIFRQYGLVSAPVVNEEGRIIGLIGIDDVVGVIEEEAEEDIMRLGGVKQHDFHSSPWITMRQRFPWLLVNLFTAIAASFVIGIFEGSIQQLAALAVLMPIVASMGGNAGTQTLTVAVRAIATRELTTTNTLRVVGKELGVGILNGLAFACVVGVASYIWYGNVMLSLALAGATVVTLIIAGLSGTLIPLWLMRVGVDPAIASGIVLTTITDIVGFGVFLWLGAMILL